MSISTSESFEIPTVTSARLTKPAPLQNIFDPLTVSPLGLDLNSSASPDFSDAQTP